MTSWDGMNRRKFPRVYYPCLIVLRCAQGEQESILTHTENIGIGGVCVTINRNIPMFSPVELEIDLLDTESHIKCHGKVVWAIQRKLDEKKKPLFYDLGIEFSDIPPNDQKRLDEVVKRFVKRGYKVLD